MSLRRLHLAVLVLGFVALGGALQSCSVIEDILSGLARICDQPELVVTKTEDTDDGICTSDDCSLREAVITANNCPGPQSIRLPAGHYPLTLAGVGEDQARTGDLDITDDLTIRGEGAPSISGENEDRIFEVHRPASVELDLLILINGRADLGGAVRNHGTLTIRSSSIHDNASTSEGGGIFNETGELTLVDTQIFENQAQAGGGVSNFATARLVMQDSLLQGNVATGTIEGSGGGGLRNNVAGTAELTNVEVRANRAAANGGGIYSDGNLEATGLVFAENVSGGSGGGLYNGPSGELEGTSLATGDAFVRDSWFTNNNAQLGGGAYNRGLLHLYRTGVNNNTAFAGQGGGLANVTSPDGAVHRSGYSGAMLLLRNVTVSGNMLVPPEAPGGAGLYNDGGSLRIEFSTFAYNSPDGVLSTGGPEVGFKSSILAYHAGGNCSGVSGASGGYNVDDADTCGFRAVGDQPNSDPMLMPLANYGGPSLSHALSLGSPAVDTGDLYRCISTDQRGVARPQGPRCDIGAVEIEPGGEAPPPMPGDTEPTTAPPTATPTPEPPPVEPMTMNFNADSYSLTAGDCTILRWEVKNADEVLLEGDPVEALNARQVCPQATKTYRLLGLQGEEQLEGLVMIEVSAPQEPPAAPGQLDISNRVCTDQAYSVTLGWIDTADNEDGYRVYRDGNLIATLGANSASYTDNPPGSGPYTYGVEAFNDVGPSSRPTVQEAGCIY